MLDHLDLKDPSVRVIDVQCNSCPALDEEEDNSEGKKS
jgi:hypothetical protein